MCHFGIIESEAKCLCLKCVLQVNATDSSAMLKVTVGSVLHYAEYTIEVLACHDQTTDKFSNRTVKLCSNTAVTSVRSKEIGKYRPAMSTADGRWRARARVMD